MSTAVGVAGVVGYQTTSAESRVAIRPAGIGFSPPPDARMATGADVNFGYGDLQVRVMMSGPRIVRIMVVRLALTNPRSALKNRAFVPALDRRAMAAQSAAIHGVSGASYTSQAYKQSLQSALDQLGAPLPPVA